MNGESVSKDALAIDVVIPTVRLDPSFLCGLLDLPRPGGVSLRYYVVIDQPDASTPLAVIESLCRENVTLIVNEENCGAAESRNRGFAAGRSPFVLFLDDDVVAEPTLLDEYASAITADVRQSPGYAGVTRFPPAINRFTRGVRASDVLTFFDVAANRPTLQWGVTANLCVWRESVVGVPFRSLFPKQGGGEDIDFCLRIRDAVGLPFKSVPRAVVHHPWWNGGARCYRRFFRWAYGDGLLPTLHPRHRYLNFPTLPELWLVLLLVLPFLLPAGWDPMVGMFLAGATMIEFGVDYTKLLHRRAIDPLLSAEATVVRLANDLGRLVGHVRNARIRGFLERFDYFGTGESIAYERSVAGAKFVGWIILAGVIFA